jgi:hypothetical protein
MTIFVGVHTRGQIYMRNHEPFYDPDNTRGWLACEAGQKG